MKCARAASATEATVSVSDASTFCAMALAAAISPVDSRASARSRPVSWRGLAALQHVLVGFLVEFGLVRAVHLLVHVHAVDHFAHGLFQAHGVLLELQSSARRSIASARSPGAYRAAPWPTSPRPLSADRARARARSAAVASGRCRRESCTRERPYPWSALQWP